MNGVFGLLRDAGAGVVRADMWEPVIEARRAGIPWSVAIADPSGWVVVTHEDATPAVPAGEGNHIAIAALGNASLILTDGIAVAYDGYVTDHLGGPGRPITEDDIAAIRDAADPGGAITTLTAGIHPMTLIAATPSALYAFRRGTALYRTQTEGVWVVTPTTMRRTVMALPDRVVTEIRA